MVWNDCCASYKEFKELRKESLRDNMSDIEVALTDLGEIAARELAKKHKPFGMDANKEVAKAGSSVAKVAKESLESKLGQSVVTLDNMLNYKYKEDKIKLKNN